MSHCVVRNNRSSVIEQVFTESGKESILYKDIVNKLPSNIKLEDLDSNTQLLLEQGIINNLTKAEVGLGLYLQYKDYNTEGKVDENNEPLLNSIEGIKIFNRPDINYVLKAVDILSSDKAKQVFDKGKKSNWDLNKILTELQIPKEQKQLILDSGLTNREEIITSLLANYSYTIEINTAKAFTSKDEGYLNTGEFIYQNNNYKIQGDEDYGYEYFKNNEEITAEQFREALNESGIAVMDRPTQHYSNLTVPGGTNGSYREQNFETPLIKVPKSHAQFNTENTIGFNRNDDRQVYTEKDIDSLMEIMKKSGVLEVKC
jgi:hypothetical protein